MPLGSNIRALRSALNWTLEQLSDASGVDTGTINALENRGSKRSSFASQLARGFGVPVELLLSTDPEDIALSNLLSARGNPSLKQGHPVSLRPATVASQISWEDVVQGRIQQEFVVALPDDSMAPRAPTGTQIIFKSVAEGERIPFGCWVIVRNKSGGAFVRLYRESTSEKWEAHAFNDGYRTMLPSVDGLSVVAVMKGVLASSL